MFKTEPITGDQLPDSALVLTYDDGPGPNTLPVAEYLSGMGIEATFFVVGEFAATQPNVLARVRALGHRLGNAGRVRTVATALLDDVDLIERTY